MIYEMTVRFRFSSWNKKQRQKRLLETFICKETFLRPFPSFNKCFTLYTKNVKLYTGNVQL